MQLFLADDTASISLGKKIALNIPQQQFVIHLKGDLGAGKTTFSRGLIQALGHTGNVKSPTYTLVEHYQLASRDIFHFDLYRLSDPEELDYLGIDDYFSGNSLCLIEWPQQAGSALPPPDLLIELSYHEAGRLVEITALSETAEQLMKKLEIEN
jgi:tRNA threonylcarbamoyladenosine biosynthesis protein TsaE